MKDAVLVFLAGVSLGGLGLLAVVEGGAPWGWVLAFCLSAFLNVALFFAGLSVTRELIETQRGRFTE